MSYFISGNCGAALATVQYQGTAQGQVTADNNGDYIILGLENGTYVITPSLEDHSFTPSSRTETILGGNLVGINFKDPAQASGRWLTVNADNALKGLRH